MLLAPSVDPTTCGRRRRHRRRRARVRRVARRAIECAVPKGIARELRAIVAGFEQQCVLPEVGHLVVVRR